MKHLVLAILLTTSVLAAAIAAPAQQRARGNFAAALAVRTIPVSSSETSELVLLQEPEKPEDEMGTSGFFLGIVGMLGGAAIGSAVGQAECADSDDKGCIGRYASTGALAAGTALVPLGVHLASKNRRSLPLSMAISALTGTAFYFALRAIPGEPVAMAPFLATPVQVFTSVKLQTRK